MFVDAALADYPVADGSEPPVEVGARIRYADTFKLHSNVPTSKRTIYLDFDGHDGDRHGVEHRPTRRASAFMAAPFDADGTPASFSDDGEGRRSSRCGSGSPRTTPPFDIDVTTEEPDAGRHHPVRCR